MKIAVTYNQGWVFQHFGHTEKFKIYETTDTEIIKTEVVNTASQGHSALGQFLKDNGVEVLICGGIGGCAIEAINAAGIKYYAGVKGLCDEAVKAYLSGTLSYNPDARCEDHDKHEHNCH